MGIPLEEQPVLSKQL